MPRKGQSHGDFGASKIEPSEAEYAAMVKSTVVANGIRYTTLKLGMADGCEFSRQVITRHNQHEHGE